MPLTWSTISESHAIIEILSSFLHLELNPKPLEKLKLAVNIAARNYQVHYNPNYRLPEDLDLSERKGVLINKLAHEENLKRSESLNDRSVLLYLRGLRQEALDLATKSLEINPLSFEAYMN